MEMNYMNYGELPEQEGGYTGPSGYLGDEPLPETPGDGEQMPWYLSVLQENKGRHGFDIGLVIGPSLTVNPVADLRITAYWHFAPSGGMFLRYSTLEAGYIPYMNYGVELSYRWFGIGVERKYGIASFWNINNYAVNGSFSDPAKYKLEGYSFYVAFRF